jgi:hypothetical protein
MSGRNSVAIYEAVAVDVVDSGADRPVALAIVAAGKEHVLIRMDHEAMVRLQARISAAFTRRKAVGELP